MKGVFFMYYRNLYQPMNNDDRFGGFFVPFLLGGLTGSAQYPPYGPRPYPYY